MKHSNNSAAAALFLLCLAGARTSAAQNYGVIHNFEPSQGDPVSPVGTLRPDASGTLFGTASDGTTYQLKMAAHGGWTVNKTPNGPGGSEWIPDAAGNYYAPVIGGGSSSNGAILESSPNGKGGWTEKVIYSFGSTPTDGISPSGSLVFDMQGNLYGTTQAGGTNSAGTAYELTQGAGGRWTEKILYNFGASSTDAALPQGLTIDASGNLYGTTALGGPLYPNMFVSYFTQGGTVYELTRQGNGEWQENILHAFVPSTIGEFGYQTITGDGWAPQPGLILDNQGTLYGTTSLGVTLYGFTGPSGTITEGTVFKLGQTIPYQVLFLNCDNQSDCFPNSAPIIDSAGNLYDVTAYGGSNNGNDDGSGDTAFEVTHDFDQIKLHDFPSITTDGRPGGGLTLSEGNLFGVTYNGGPDSFGTAYEIQGVTNPTPVETTTTLEASPTGSFKPGAPITLTATVTPASGLIIPSGTVRFVDATGGCNTAHRVTELLVAGKAAYSGVIPRAGTYSVKACYSGGPGFALSESAATTAPVQ